MQLKTTSSLRALLQIAEKHSLHKLKEEKGSSKKQKSSKKLTSYSKSGSEKHHRRAQRLTKTVTSKTYNQLKKLFSKIPSHK